MSADNGIYVLCTPAPPIKNGGSYTNRHGEVEYRVAHCQAIENIDYSDLYIPWYFGYSEVYTSREEAQHEAERLLAEWRYCEYGIVWLVRDKYFPNMTPQTAQKALDCYVGATPV